MREIDLSFYKIKKNKNTTLSEQIQNQISKL